MSDSPVSGHCVRESPPTGLPRIVCLCGSTKHTSVFDQANRDETLAGRIVLTVGVDLKDRHKDVLAGKTDTEAVAIKDRLDCLHRRKIDLADEILVLNVDGPPGESTQREIEYEGQMGKTGALPESACIDAELRACLRTGDPLPASFTMPIDQRSLKENA